MLAKLSFLLIFVVVCQVSAKPQLQDYDYSNNEVDAPALEETVPDLFVEPEQWEEFTFITVLCNDEMGQQHEECQRVHYGAIQGNCDFFQLGCYERFPSLKNEEE